ncbi:(2S)-3-sulfopropanediol dehydratase-like [Branchiostoma lanceolatum]|uniref:(2S)-3-sulfopropanediol dehydratase-like n=1 Tax=Branchiostoma lanceolatum TaxID=7740 RepID=UPI0034514348
MASRRRVDQQQMPPAKRMRHENGSVAQAQDYAAALVKECDAKPIGKVQPGLLASKPKHGVFITVTEGVGPYKQEIMTLIRSLRDYGSAAGERTWAVVAFNPDLWENWQNGDISLEKRPEGDYLLPDSTKFVNTGGDVFFFLKSDSLDNVRRLENMVTTQLAKCQLDFVREHSEPGNNRVIGGLFADGLANPTDVENIDDFIITTDVDKGATGGSYMLTQKFVFNWTILDDMTQDQLENMIGRTVTDDILVVDDTRRHIKCAHILDKNGKHPLVFRQSMPYGSNNTGVGREEGTFYISCANTCQRFLDILKKLIAEEDKLISTVQAEEGSFWYVPNAEELGLTPIPVRNQLQLMPQWDVKSDNGYMFYNSREYLYRMTTGGYKDPQDTPSSRVLKLMGLVMTDWQRSWFEKQDEPQIPDLKTFLNEDDENLLRDYNNAIPIRKGLATFYTLTSIACGALYSKQFDLYRIYPDELIAGVMPSFSLGLGKRVMTYLTDDEQIRGYQMGVLEAAAIGHVVPDHQVILDKGLQALIDEMDSKATKQEAEDKQMFFLSAKKSLMGVQAYMESYAQLADNMSREETSFTEEQKANLRRIRFRMQKLAKDKPDTFLEAAQLVFTMHCCLHIVGEPISIGRLDQLLGPFYPPSGLTMEEAQEVIDCFWIKVGERTLLNRHAAQDMIFPGMCAVPYTSSGNFPQGGCMNQWGQQLTIGGYLPNDDRKPMTACNEVTLMCLRAARRLPLNAPCLTLRLHDGISQEVLEETAKALLSGGAHPVLLHDDRLVPALQESGRRGIPVRLEDARNYACDGCFEPVFVGGSEFAFCTFFLLDAVEMALNEGTLYSQAGPHFLRGTKKSFPSPNATQIKDFPEFQEIFLQHLRLQIPLLVSFLVGGYGNIWKVCPSPLLSVMMKGCIEAGRDHSNGGTEYHDLGFMFVGGADAIDSLYAIKKLVYDPLTALTTLPDLLTCLKCDWGFDMKEYLIDVRAGPGRAEAQATFFRHLRDVAVSLPKFGHGENEELKELATWMFENVLKILRETFDDPPDAVGEIFERLEKDYSLPDRPFGFVALPGIGTFEAYVGYGLNSAASADGRRSGQPIASDLSPAPVPQDLPANPDSCDIYKALKCWDLGVINHGLSCGSEVDLMIREDFPLDKLTEFLRRYADLDGPIGSNVITVTCANPETLEKASQVTDAYELVRVRQGGWTEFFITLFPVHQGQLRRRMYVHP